ncbi:hypothetical protein AGMMS49992_32860 [Clostridia bacterium]|nr:hypothetical protein AGMMS49992_32860 [Clostridia bacterium]
MRRILIFIVLLLCLPIGVFASELEDESTTGIVSIHSIDYNSDPTSLEPIATQRVYDGKIIIKETWVDDYDNLVMNKDGYCYYTIKLSARRQPALKSFYDTDDNPVTTNQGYASIKYTYDGLGTLLETEYFDIDGLPINSIDGYAKMVNTYKGRKLSTIEYFDEDGSPVTAPGKYAKKTLEYDSRLRIIKEAYFDAEGQPMTISDGYSYALYERDLGNVILSEQFFDAEDNPVISKKGYAALYQTFAARLRISSTEYRDETGALMPGPKGWARMEVKYSNVSSNQRSKELYYGVDGNLVLLKDGYAGIEYKYESNRLRQKKYIGVDGYLTIVKDGYAIAEYYYYDTKVKHELFFGVDGEAFITALSEV